MRGDGDGWAFAATGDRYWGRYGAAGILLRAPRPDGTQTVLLQHRAWWSHQGGTWALPGGARDSHETAEEAAIREAQEEAGLPAERIVIRAAMVTKRVAVISGVSGVAGGAEWTYTTVVAEADELLPVVPNGESTELRWVDTEHVAGLRLHPAFAASWPRLRELPGRPPVKPPGHP